MSETPQLRLADDTPLITEPRAKLAAIGALAIAFQKNFKPRHHANKLMRQYDPLPGEKLEALGVLVGVAGRMMLKRVMGEAAFCTLQNRSMGPGGSRIRRFFTKHDVAEWTYGPRPVPNHAAPRAATV